MPAKATNAEEFLNLLISPISTRKLNEEAIRLADQEDKLVTSFVTENFDNVLGPGVFFMVTMRNQYPMLSPWIEDIMSKATEHFKNDPYVKDYYQKAQENEQIMNGTRDAGQDASAMQAPQVDPSFYKTCDQKFLCFFI